jgi:hypothetical protein
VLLLVAALLGRWCAPASTATTKRAWLFGDSLTYESEWAQKQIRGWSLQTSAFGGLAVCDMLAGLPYALASHPTQVAIETAGNSFTSCMKDADGDYLTIGTSADFAKIRKDLKAFFSKVTDAGATVVFMHRYEVATP